MASHISLIRTFQFRTISSHTDETLIQSHFSIRAKSKRKKSYEPEFQAEKKKTILFSYKIFSSIIICVYIWTLVQMKCWFFYDFIFLKQKYWMCSNQFNGRKKVNLNSCASCRLRRLWYDFFSVFTSFIHGVHFISRFSLRANISYVSLASWNGLKWCASMTNLK